MAPQNVDKDKPRRKDANHVPLFLKLEVDMGVAKRRTKGDRQAKHAIMNAIEDKRASVKTSKIKSKYAASRNARERDILLDEIEQHEEALLDDALELTFPASDPISIPSYYETSRGGTWRQH